MRKMISIGLAAVMLLSSFGLCFAAEETSASVEEISPRFAAVRDVESNVVITGGNALFYVKVMPKSSTSISYINVTLKLGQQQRNCFKDCDRQGVFFEWLF